MFSSLKQGDAVCVGEAEQIAKNLNRPDCILAVSKLVPALRTGPLNAPNAKWTNYALGVRGTDVARPQGRDELLDGEDAVWAV